MFGMFLLVHFDFAHNILCTEKLGRGGIIFYILFANNNAMCVKLWRIDCFLRVYTS